MTLENNKIKIDGNNVTISDTLVSDQDINYILKNEIYLDKNITFFKCYIEFRALSNKDILKFVSKCKVEGCEIYKLKKIKLNKTILSIINQTNIIYESDFLTFFLNSHNNSLESLDEGILEGIVLKDIDLTNVDLGINTEFFQLIKNQKVENVLLPQIDFNKFNIDGVEFVDCKFKNDTIFPDDFFQHIRNKKLVGCSLPPIDFNKKDMNDVSFMFTNFANESKFPLDIDFFKKFNIISSCKLPVYDYTKYDFKGANMKYCLFKEKSILPSSYYLNNESITNDYPKSFVKLLHIIPIKDLNYDEVMFKYGDYLTEQQKVLIYFKLKDNKNI